MWILLLIALLLLFPALSEAAITEVGSGSQRASTTVSSHSGTLAFPGNVTSGNLLVAGGCGFRNDASISSISVTSSRATYSSVHYVIDTKDWCFIAYGIATSGGADSITVDIGGSDSSSTLSFGVDEFTQAGGNQIVLSVDGGGSTGTGTPATDSLVTLTANELVLGVKTQDSPGGTTTPDAGWTQIGEQESQSVESYNFVFQVVTTATTYTASWTMNSSTWYAETASFKEVAAGGGSSFFRRRVQ